MRISTTLGRAVAYALGPPGSSSQGPAVSRIELVLLGVLATLAILTSFAPPRQHQGGRLVATYPQTPTSTYTAPMPYSQARPARPPATRASPKSPPQGSRRAYATLCIGDAFVFGTLTLFHSLKKTSPDADLVALVSQMSDNSVSLLHAYGVRTYPVPRGLDVSLYRASKVDSMQFRDGILWSKLRVWQLEDYDRVVLLDTDLFVLRNVDELFAYPELAASPIIDRREKINFWRSPEMGMRVRNKNTRDIPLLHWSGLNSGVSVLTPSNDTFTALVTEIGILPNRPCCPSQEFLYFFFEERGRFFRLPPVYNARMSHEGMSESEQLAFYDNVKVYHFVGAKPWKKQDNGYLNRLWWSYAREMAAFFVQRHGGGKLDLGLLQPAM